MKKDYAKHDEEFKKMIVNLCETNKDKTMSDIAREYGITRTRVKEETTQKPETNNNNNSNNNNSDNNTTTVLTYKYTATEVRQKIQEGYNQITDEDGFNNWRWGGGTPAIGFIYRETINVSSNTLNTMWEYDFGSGPSYTCHYNYVKETMYCSNFSNARNYVLNPCQKIYNQYLDWKQNGNTENKGIGEEWKSRYISIDDCVNEVILSSRPTDYR